MKATTSVDIEQNYWDKEMQYDNFKKVETRNSNEDAYIYYNMFIKDDGDESYNHRCMASRCVFHNSGGDAIFGLQKVYAGKVEYEPMYYNWNYSITSRSCWLTPIVTLPSKYIDVSSGYNDLTGWDMK